VTCGNGHVLPGDAHPDDGTGYRGPDGRIHYFVGTWNAWVTEQWTLNAIPALARAYALTGDEKYAERAAFFLDALAAVYAESSAGSWDYPSRPPSGRLARPWYQVARTLVVMVEAYDLIYESRALEQPSVRLALEPQFPAGSSPQTVAVGTAEAHGRTWPGMTRRDNININMMQDGAYYCYVHTFDGRLHNGHADYVRGALAVGCLLGIPDYIRWATEGPYSIYAMLHNNVDRDGRYYETSLPYAHHTRNLYLSFADPLLNWREEQPPGPGTGPPRGAVDLYSDARFRHFYTLPDLVMDCAGHTPNFGDAAPDNRFALLREPSFSAVDYAFAEHAYARARRPQDQALFASVLKYLSGGDLDRLRAAAGPSLRAWLLFHADDLPRHTADLPPDLLSRVRGSWFLGHKGIGLLRAGAGDSAQAALLRWGPSLNHADFDELSLLYYGGGWQLTYDIGYGLGSTHTHVGWASQTASHNLVVVNETSQLKGRGSGGSLRLFATAPGLQVAEASDENAYASEGVSLYQRTVALVGGGLPARAAQARQSASSYLVDIFRVVGGRQHDYFLGAQSQDREVAGVTLGPEETGSLAGADISWGTRIGNDGDVIGYPNKPYWNPPPGNGYGFFYGVRRGAPKGDWRVTWHLGGPLDTRFRAHFLPPAGSEAIVADAPGLYPQRGYGSAQCRNAAYAVVRRRGSEPLNSTFVTIMEPQFRPPPSSLVTASELHKRLTTASAETKLLADLNIVLLKGEQAGHKMTFALDAPSAGHYVVCANALKAPSYGTARFLLDDQPVGEPFDAWAPQIEGPVLVALGRRALSAGRHSLVVLMSEPARSEKHYYLGLAGVALQPVEERDALETRPVITSVERLECPAGEKGEVEPVGLKVALADGHVDYLFSGGLGDPRRTYKTPYGKAEVGGALAYLRLAPDGRVVQAVLSGADWLRLDKWTLRAPTRAYQGEVIRVDEERGAIYTSARLPADGSLDGQMVYFVNEGYSRTAPYRLQRVEATRAGSILHFGERAFALGRGYVLSLPDEHTILSSIPHEYACPLGGSNNSRFFDGKLVTNDRAAATRLIFVLFGMPMTLKVQTTRGFAPGDTLWYRDIQPGDRFVLPTVAVFASPPAPAAGG
jgi:hypothetical protein